DGDDGCLEPFGVSFVGAPSGQLATVVLAWNDPTDGTNDTSNDIYSGTITLGAASSLGTARVDSALNHVVITPLITPLKLPSLAGGQGNPHYGSPWLWFDDESVTEKDLYAARGTTIDGAFTAQQKIAISQPGRGEIQPFADGSRLYYTVNTISIVSAD